MRRRSLALGTLLAAAAKLSSAQRADVNVVTDANDAFGYSAAGDAIGLYSDTNVRGFSPARAGNTRIDGLYFDKQGRFSNDPLDSTRIQVGLNAVDFPFASPSGVADYRLKHAAADAGSIALSLGPYGTRDGSVEVSRGLPGDRLGIVAAATHSSDRYGTGGEGSTGSWGLVVDGKLGDGVTASVLVDRQRYWNSLTDPSLYSSGDALPPKLPRGLRLSQNWARENGSNDNAGVLVAAALAPAWSLRAALFWSQWLPARSYDSYFTDADVPGTTRRWVVASAHGVNRSVSGELRLVHDWTLGDAAQRDVWSIRGRDLHRRYGGEAALDLGPNDLTPLQMEKPTGFAYGAQDQASLSQSYLGLYHQSRWNDRLQTSLGLQRVMTRSGITPAGQRNDSDAQGDWLRSGGVTFKLSDTATIFAAYDEGSESLGTAPVTATNPNQLLPNVISTQKELGVRLGADKRWTLQLNGFALDRPFAGFDGAGAFRSIGELSNRGIEVSLSSHPLPGLTLLGGLVWMDARVTSSVPSLPRKSDRPVGVATQQALLYADYVLPGWPNTEMDLSVQRQNAVLVDAATGLRAPPRTSVGLGLRWAFAAFGQTTRLRASLDNVFNEYSWIVDNAGGLQYSPPRSITLSISRPF